MSWPQTAGVFFATVGILFVPGLIVGLALGARRFAVLALAPAFTISILAVGSAANHILDFRWGVLPVLIVTVLLGGVVFGIAWLGRKRWTSPTLGKSGNAAWIATGSGLLFAFIALGWRFMSIFGAPNHISQTFDNIFHLNAVNYIVQTGTASPLKVGSLTYEFDGAVVFYPDMWHAFVALLADLTGASVPIAVNVASIVLGAVMWPLACMFLVRVLVGARPIALLATGVLSAAFPAFPYLMVDFGVLYPNLLSISILPVGLGLVVMACGFGAERSLSPLAIWMAIAAVLPGLALAHPSTLMALIAFSVPVVIASLIRRFRGLGARRAGGFSYLVTAVSALAGFALAAIILYVARPTREAAFWGPREPVESAVMAALNNSFMDRPGDWGLALLAVLGIVSLRRARTNQWLIGSYLVAAGLYVIAASFQAGTYRYLLTGIWYNDSFRLASLLPVLALPVSVVGILWIADVCGRRSAKWQSERALARPTDRLRASVRSRPVTGIVGCLVVAGIAVTTQTGAALASATESAQARYTFTEESSLLSPDEFKLLDRLDDEVPAGAAVIGSPWTGTSLVFALADRRALLPHIYGYRDPATMKLIMSLRDANIDPAVCDAVRELDAYYALDFGDREVHGAENPLPGLTDLEDSTAVELIDEEGDAKLYRVDVCD